MADTGNARADPAANYRYTGQRPPNPRHLAIALQHANQIQAQKDAQALILDRILQLIEFPTSADSADPAHPSAEDATALKTALVPFQPADFDNLVLERNIEGRCGYALCPRENRKEDPKVKFRILWGPKGSGDNGRGREMKVVPREKLEMWCSNQCAKRAMYLRVQLAEEPVWERRAVDARTKPLELLEEAHKPEQEAEQGRSIENRTLEQQLENLTVSDGPSSTVARDESASQLALERGDTSRTSGINSRVDVVIRERDIQQSQEIPPAPITRTGDRSGGSIEGYVPQGVQLKHARESDSPDESIDILDSI